MRYDFDKVPDRRGTCSIKWSDEIMDEINGKKGLLPFWVADMDFPCPQPVIDAVIEEARCGVYGYSCMTEGYKRAFLEWNLRRHGWQVEEGWLVFSPGVVIALNAAVQEFTSPGDKVIVQSPVYHPFFHSIENNGRHVLENKLIEGADGDYSMDFEDLEQKASDPDAKVIFLCSPHNPVGRVWREDELTRFGEICVKHGLIIVADEIHSDLIYSGHKHVPFAKLSGDFAACSITCTAPSKTFNLAGLQVSNIIVQDPELRSRLERRLESNGISEPNFFGVAAAGAAYAQGEEWLGQVLSYLEGNADFIGDFLKARLPQIHYRKPEGTYLAWLDFRALNLDKDGLKELLADRAGLALNQGFIFGSSGDGFARLNFACPRALLKEGLERIEMAIKA